MTQIMNGGVRGAILRIAIDSAEAKGEKLTDDQEDQLAMLEALPENVWIDLDENGRPISKDRAEKEFDEHLSQFVPVNQVKKER